MFFIKVILLIFLFVYLLRFISPYILKYLLNRLIKKNLMIPIKFILKKIQENQIINQINLITNT